MPGNPLNEQLKQLGTTVEEQNKLFGASKPTPAPAPKQEKPEDGPTVPGGTPGLRTEELKPEEIKDLVEVAMKVVKKKILKGKEKKARKIARLKAKKTKGKRKLAAKKFRKSARGKKFQKAYAKAQKKYKKGGKKLKGKRISIRMDRDSGDLRDRLVERFATEVKPPNRDLKILDKAALCCMLASDHLREYEYEEDADAALKVGEQIMDEVEKHEKAGTTPSEDDFSQMIETMAIVVDQIEKNTVLPFSSML